MKFRWKLMILLLSISIVPMAVGRVFGVRAVRQIGDELREQTQKKIIAETRSRLRLLVDAYAQILWKGREQVEMALVTQAMAVERALGNDNVRYPDRVHFAEDFERGTRLPEGTMPSDSHRRLKPDGQTEMLNVSRSAQVFKLVPGLKAADVASDIHRLSAVTPVYQRVYRSLRDVAVWHYTVLENGLHSAYPGHGGIPDELDLRRYPWYQQAMNKPVPWSDPYVDPSIRQVVVAAATPVYRPNGVPAGETAIVVPISRLLNQRKMMQAIPPESEAFLCYIARNPDTGSRGARVFAREDHADLKQRSWRSQPGSEWLTSGDAEAFQAMLDDVLEGTGNVRNMHHQGCDCLWAYSPVHGGAFLVVLIPRAGILQPMREVEKTVRSLIDRLIHVTGYGMMVVILTVVVAAFFFSRTVTEPLQALTNGAMKLSDGRFETRVNIRTRDEFGEMGRVFNHVVPRLEAYYRMRRSMLLAGEVQQSLLPRKNPLIEGLDVAGSAVACDETGGDFYDFLDIGPQDEKRAGIVIGDVSDHGLPSALSMASARAYLRQRASIPGELPDMVSDVNRQLAVEFEMSGRFMTLFFLKIDTLRRCISWVRAGHDPGIWYDPETDAFDELSTDGIALGVEKEVNFELGSRQMAPGRIVVLFTDGVWETHNPDGKMFGKGRLRDIIRTHADKPAEAILQQVLSELEKFRRGAALEDDVTLVVVKFKETH